MLKRLFFKACRILGRKNYADCTSLVAMYFTAILALIAFLIAAYIIAFTDYYHFIKRYREIIYPLYFIAFSALYFYLYVKFTRYAREVDCNKSK